MKSKSSLAVGIVGATGAAGQELLHLLHARSFPFGLLRVYASARSAGKTLEVAGQRYVVEEAKPGIFADLDVAFFAAGGPTTRALAPDAVKAGCLVIDKSSTYRMDPAVPLVIPEINPEALRSHSGIIANPNCSTAVALMGLYPLHRRFGLKRCIAATYQSVSGSGVAGVRELEGQVEAHVKGGAAARSIYAYPIAFNVIPQVDAFGPNGYTGEETKMQQESRKILGLPNLPFSSTCVRVPVIRAHSVAISAEFEQPVDVEQARAAVAAFAGAELVDEPARQRYPTPLEFSRQVKCGVGRIRKDTAFENGLAFWVSGDNLWKGAALNAIQNAELLAREGLLKPKGVLVG
ncbi:MAG TPA: aspartate-semialdehyde dehydrogenase [Opitutaceae bacterium]|jgi:aspartate-semialdehyde dehydrogenase|nr:aspartate-semialdehyde dehydrogenase [Opitutaceae bacterium]